MLLQDVTHNVIMHSLRWLHSACLCMYIACWVLSARYVITISISACRTPLRSALQSVPITQAVWL